MPLLSLFFPDVTPRPRYLNRAEALVYYNRRGMRPGIIGDALDGATGKALDRAANNYELRREHAVWRGFKLPWLQSDEVLRSRIWLAFQDKHYDPTDKTLHFYP